MTRFVTEGLRTVFGGPFSFAVERGQCLMLSGPSGCGKTLLLRALADLDPAEGTVLLDGENRSAMSAPQWRKKVGWLPAESSWWYDVVGDHFRSQGAEDRGQNDSNILKNGQPQRSCFRVLETLGFEEDVLGWRIDRLSTGEKQRLALFRLLLNEPHVLLLDEPTAALDPKNVGLVEDVIAAYRRNTEAAVIWVSHHPEQIQRVANQHLVFLNGRLEAAI